MVTMLDGANIEQALVQHANQELAARPTVIVRIRFNPHMKWWQASLTENCPDGTMRPFRAQLANIITARSHAECARQTEQLLNTLQVQWIIEDVGDRIIGT